VEGGLLRDRDWAALDGEICRVMSLTHLGVSGPYASIEIESPSLPEPTTGFVTHTLDYQHLSDAFQLHETNPETEVLIIWTKKNLKRSAKLFARFMPRMWVMLSRAESYEVMLDSNYQSASGLTVSEASIPIADWKPDVIE
jgi:hypothetical protein